MRLVSIRIEKSLEIVLENINLYTNQSIEANILLAPNWHQYVVHVGSQLCAKFDFNWTSTE